MASNAISIVVLGNLTLDDTVLADGTVRMAIPGGNALYGAASARLWTDSVGVVTRVGRGYPEYVLQDFEQVGVASEGWRPTSQQPLRTWVLYEDMQTRRYVSRHTEASRIQLVTRESFDTYQGIVDQHQLDLSPEPSDIPLPFEAAQVFHLAPIVAQRQMALLRHLSEISQSTVLLDPHYDLMVRRDDSSFEELLAQADLFLPSEEDLAARYGDFEQDTLKRLVELGPRVAGVKRGEQGSLLYAREEGVFYRVPSYPAIPIDTTGAGDAFCAGFAAALANGADVAEAAACGTASASFVIQAFGGLHLLQTDGQEARERKAWVLERIS